MVLFRNGGTELLLARRAGEADFNATYTLTGGKLETTDGSIVNGLKREKTEELGKAVHIKICPFASFNVYFVKHNGQHMILPHYYAEYVKGKIQLSDEYSDFRWIPTQQLASFTPKIENIIEIANWAQRVRTILGPKDFVEI
jgi:ADP-ribose pyrophosphatase YjhB (NUDIX family)